MATNPKVPAREDTEKSSAAFQIKNANIYVTVVTLSVNDDIMFLENIKQGFKRATSQNKYRYEITTWSKIII